MLAGLEFFGRLAFVLDLGVATLPPASKWTARRPALTRHHIHAIGLLIYRWAAFEVQLADSLARFIMAGTKESHKAETAAFAAVIGMEARVKLGLLKSIVRLHYPAEGDAFDRWADRALALKKHRDTVAHSNWERAKRPGYIRQLAVTTVGRIRRLAAEYSAADITARANEIDALLEDLGGFLWRGPGVVLVHYSVLRDKSPELAPVRRMLRQRIREDKSVPPTRGKRPRQRQQQRK